MFVQDGFLYLVVTRHKLTVCRQHCHMQETHVQVQAAQPAVQICSQAAQATVEQIPMFRGSIGCSKGWCRTDMFKSKQIKCSVSDSAEASFT